MSVDFYELLGVARSADAETIRGAIRETRRRHRQMVGSPDRERAHRAEVVMDMLARAEETLLVVDRRQQYDSQLAVVRESPADPPPTPSSSASRWVEAAATYLSDGQPRNALLAAREATQADPEDADAWRVRATAALQLRDLRDADFAANEAHRLRPHDPQALGLIGDVYDSEERYADAERAFARAAALEPDNPYWAGRVAWAVGDRGDLDGAVQRARQLVSQYPDAEYVRLVLAHQLLGQADGALSRDPAGQKYFTNTKQVDYVEQRLAEVEALRPLHESAETGLAQAREHLAVGRRRRWVAPSGGTVTRVVLYVLLGAWIALALLTAIAGDTFGGLLWLLLNVALVWRLVRRVYPTQWAVNRRALGPHAMTGVQ